MEMAGWVGLGWVDMGSSSSPGPLSVAIGARQTRRDLETLLRQAPAGARDLKCFLERKAISVKRTRFGGIWPDLTITIIAGNFLWWLVLALPVTSCEEYRRVHHPVRVRPQNSQVQESA